MTTAATMTSAAPAATTAIDSNGCFSPIRLLKGPAVAGPFVFGAPGRAHLLNSEQC